jgi:hypothetical protein
MNAEIKQLYVRFCVVVRAILAHPDCTNNLLLVLGNLFTHERNNCFDGPTEGPATSAAKIVDHAKALTFGLHEDLEETDAHAIALPKPAKESVPLASLFAEFGDIVGQIIEHADVPTAVSCAVHDICVEATNDSNHFHPGHHVAWAQYFTPHCLALLAGLSVHAPRQDEARRSTDSLIAENARLKLLLEQAQSREMAAMQTANDFEEMAAELTRYAPEVEARRADYDQLTEALILMTRLESNHVQSRLDVTGLYEGDEGHFIKAFHAHLRTLTVFNLDWFNARTLRKFYTEMRLWHDQLQLETQQTQKAKAAA